MMFPSPSASDMPSGHGAERAAQPNGGIYVHDPNTNYGHRGERVDQDSLALLLDAGQRIKVLIPNNDAGANENDDQK